MWCVWQLGRVLVCLLSSKVDFDQRVFTVSYLMGETSGRDIVRLLARAQNMVSFPLFLFVRIFFSSV
jgi:hypothetical protein